MVKICPWRSLRIFVSKSGFMPFLPFLALFFANFCVFGHNTEFVSVSSVALHLFHMQVEEYKTNIEGSP
jgi:hypothetical protein